VPHDDLNSVISPTPVKYKQLCDMHQDELPFF